MKFLVTIILFSTATNFHTAFGQEAMMANLDTNYVRPAAVAGSFYPGSPAELAKMLAGYFHKAPKPQIDGKPMAIVAPHAGYIYSGQIAANAYKILEGQEYKTVIIISPSHTAAFKGVSVFDGRAYATPLGEVPINRELTEKIASQNDLIKISDQGHFNRPGRSEHALEVQLPFLQLTLGKFELVALIMGEQDPYTCNALGQAIAKSIGEDDDVLIIASSDLSHFHDSKTAAGLDSIVRRNIEHFDYHRLSSELSANNTEACGGGPIVAVMVASHQMGANDALVTGQGDSGDITGDKSSVVGYLSAILYKGNEQGVYEIKEDENESPQEKTDLTSLAHGKSETESGLYDDDKKVLLCIARQSIESFLNKKENVYSQKMPESCCCKSGAFVTLTKFGELRGCIGTFDTGAPLYRVIGEMARQAAFYDPRFLPVEKSEINDLELEISVLTPMKRIYNTESVEIGRDGLYIKRGYRSGVLLPQVPVEHGWDRQQFLENVCLKAGLPTTSWKDKDAELYVFQAEIFGDK